MARNKRNKGAARLLVLAGSALAGVGIWTAVTQAQSPSAAKQEAPPVVMQAAAPTSTPTPAADFGRSDAFLTRPGVLSSIPMSSQAIRQSTAPSQGVVRPRLRTRAS